LLQDISAKRRRAGWLACVLVATAVASAQTPPTEVILHDFGTSPPKGGQANALITDPSGNLYGTTRNGGLYGDGVLFKLDASSRETVLYTFTGGADGGTPYANVTLDSAGNVDGTTSAGGTSNAGVVFVVNPSGQETVLYSFTGGLDGSEPETGVVLDGSGNLYGTTRFGGAANAGVVYQLDSTGLETVLYSFTDAADGGYPSGIIRDPDGTLYGTASGGGTSGLHGRRGWQGSLRSHPRPDWQLIRNC
jgi:uncharacterized repeat protein (TIGR03803 family)